MSPYNLLSSSSSSLHNTSYIPQVTTNHNLTDDNTQLDTADQCDAFDSDIDEALTAQTMFMANLSSADLVYDEPGPSYDSDTLSEVQDCWDLLI
ncbi:hypothetical protein Tco_1079785 [Tanacetum coccineum]|uniref:Integrase, catalytic region, zinc finger, CCHC-type, peptidase aspartic, catalytic n=1 Tax=Tanacetum coccineum TaxID=301880 RepID=A0ABQ5HSV2_9ASTR